jgi:L-ribulose-5-phosphate 3-epimerase UlaE
VIDCTKNYLLGLYEKAMPSIFHFSEMLNNTKIYGFDYLEISIDETHERLACLDWTEKKFSEFIHAVNSSDTLVFTMCLSGYRRFPLGSHNESIRKRSLEIMNSCYAGRII